MLLSIQKSIVVCVCVCVCVGGGGGCSFGMCSFRSSDVLFLAIWQNFALQMPSLQQLNFFGDLTQYFSHLGSLFEPYFLKLIN